MNSIHGGNGPDQVLFAENLSVTEAHGRVKLRIPDTGKAMETVEPISVPGLLHRSATLYPDHPALFRKNKKGKWEGITYSEYEEQVRICAKAFLHLGLEKHHSVCILGFNSPEWFISSLAAIYAGGFSAGIYTTNSSEACLHCIESGKADIVVVQDEMQLKKILAVRDKFTYVKAIIQYEGEPNDSSVMSWKQLMEIGKQQSDDRLNETLKNIVINECCMLVYTSGTVGNPKAVMISHDNITWNALAISARLAAETKQEIIVSYLPLSHIAAQVVDIYLCISIGATIYFADRNALKGSLLPTLQEVRPTYFLAVPRVWEKIYEKMSQIGAQSGTIKRILANWAKCHGYEHNMDKINGKESSSWGYSLANSLILKRIKRVLGLDRCKSVVSAAAPLSPDIKKYFLSINIPIMEAFGMSEASGAHTLSQSNSFNLNSIGPALPGMKTKILYDDKQENGELCLYGRHVFMGYLNDPERTKETIDEEGWLHSGDIGRVDERGLVYITGRIKELLITAGGENVAPVPIEQNLMMELPHISNAILIGDKRKFLSVLITLKTEINPDTTPTDDLTADVKEWLNSLGCPAETVTEVLSKGPDDKLKNAIQEAVDRANQRAVSNAQRIQKFTILPRDFSIASGELGPTLKLKRNIVTAKYADVIDKLYI